MRAATGTVLGRRYRLTDPIASGGMGEVWQAHDDLLGRTVAVKVLREELVSEPGFLERFRTEARNTARLAHANIATTYDYGESDGSAWLVMELVPGEPLNDLLAREGALEPRRAMRLVAQAAAGLAAAHAAGIVHRDVKPGNLLVMPSGGVKVTDFGIARAAAEAPLTATGQVMGTAAYLAPEQATGRRDLTPAVDVYALGVLAHEMLAGERPFTGESQVAIALAQVNDPPPALPRWIPGSARELVALCLAKDPLDRPAQAGVVADVAGRIADGDDDGAMAALESAYGGQDHLGGGPSTGQVDPTVVALPPTGVMPPGGLGAAGLGAAGLGAAGAAAGEEATRRVAWGAQDQRGQQGHDDQGYDDQQGYDQDRYDQGPPRTGQRTSRGAAAGAAGYGAFDRYDDGSDGRGGERTGSREAAEPLAPARRKLTAPLIGLVAVLLLVLGVLVYHELFGSASDDKTPSTPTSTATTTVTQTASSTPSSASPSTSATSDTPTSASETPTPSSSSPTSSSPSATATSTDTSTASPTSASPSATATSPSATATSASAAPAVATTAG